MKKNIYLAFLSIPFLLMSCSSSTDAGYKQDISLQSVANQNGELTTLENGKGFDQKILHITPQSSDNELLIWQKGDQGDWQKANYLVCEIWHDNGYSGVININFYKEGSKNSQIVTQSGESSQDPQIAPKIGVLPRLKTKLIFPLKHLDGQNIFMNRFPRQLKGTVLGNRLDPQNISKVAINFGPYQKPHFTPDFEIASISLRENLPKPYPKPDEPLVDKFGQWERKDWPGKTRNEEELKQVNDSLLNLARNAKMPSGWDKYGGWKQKHFKSTGYFRTQYDGRRWWFVDPDGNAFLSVGVDGMGASASGMAEGQEDLFQWLPNKDDSLYGQAIQDRSGNTMVDFFKTNQIRAFGKNWKDKWDSITSGLMRKYALNTVANWSDLSFARKEKMPYVLPMHGFPSTETMLYRDFPDVYAPEYQQKSEKFASQLEKFKDDPYLIGYFLRNEPNWAFGKHNLAFEIFATTQPSYTKKAFVTWIADRYQQDIDTFNHAWELQLNDFNELNGQTFDEIPNDTARKDFWDFSGQMVKRYVDVPCDEVEKVDPNHLNLGMRYAWISSDLLYQAGKRFDVFSINGYSNPGPPSTREIYKRSGKPVLIGEFHFGAVDRGLPATGIQAALSQKARGTAYRYYVEQGFKRPEIIAIHYFTWTDQPVFGRFDGENYNIGFVDICNRPYPELTNAASQTNRRIYQVATGQTTPFDNKIEKIPPVHY